MMLAEGVLGSRQNEGKWLTGTALDMSTHVRDDRTKGNGVRPSDWLAVKGSGGDFTATTSYYGKDAATNGDNNNRNAYIGRRWGDGRPFYSGVYTILPPNSPTVTRSVNNADDGSTIPAAGSYHTGGAGTIACDVSYRFVSSSVSTVNPSIQVRADSGLTASAGLGLAFTDLQTLGDANNPQNYIGPSPYGPWGAYGTPDGGENLGLP
jgi:hypothetical protein